MNKSKGETVIEQLMAELDPESERYRILATAKRFKSSWVELGEKLLRLQTSGGFRDWGYSTFEEYCSREVRIRKPTAEKLTQAYRFLEREEPELLARPTEIKPLPDYRSIALLRQAQNEELPGGAYGKLRAAVMEEDKGHQAVLRQYREVTAERRSEDRLLGYRNALAAARRLRTVLTGLDDLDASIHGNLDQLIARLAELSADPAEGISPQPSKESPTSRREPGSASR
ncbi:MAG: hypothetical protein A2091_02350 [Desulfuromonadales bacterium GWD2_61_12]|nr:MAG: hypothetical protein A2005_04115 [Desulfuromonadales bacterium GWC2_61_20]OGR34146.1 MAG: hypothetical protein A2091_02350 [Desulfuromonadales bacterium GWD2_61_12]